MWRHDLDSPVGTLILLGSADGLAALLFPGGPTASRADGVPPAPAGEPLLARVVEQLGEYFAGERREFDVPLDLRGTHFQLSAWAALRVIPYGQTRTYAQQAAALGNPGAFRAVGLANNRNPVSIVVPCHRVLGADGSLIGYGGGLDTKRALLDLETAEPPLF